MSESTGWQDYDWEADTVRDVPPDKVFDRAVVTPMDGVVDHITSQLAATGTADADARRVGEAFTSMYDDPQAARASWDATIERAGYITPADTNWAASRSTDPVTGEYANLTNAEAYDWPEDLEVAPTPHEWQVDGRAATPAELQDWGARARAGERRPDPSLDWEEVSPGGYRATRPMDPAEGMDSMLAHMDHLTAQETSPRPVTLPSEATAQAAAPIAQAAVKARLVQ